MLDSLLGRFRVSLTPQPPPPNKTLVLRNIRLNVRGNVDQIATDLCLPRAHVQQLLDELFASGDVNIRMHGPMVIYCIEDAN